MPVSTTIRLPAVTGLDGATDSVDTEVACAAADWTKLGAVTAPGVTGLEAAEGGLVPTELVAVTVNVYVVPLVSPLIGVLVDEPATVVGASAVDPAYGVTV